MYEKIHQDILSNAPFGTAFHEIITDDQDQPVDFKYLEINLAFEKMTGLSADKIIGQTVKKIKPAISDCKIDWIAIYGKIALEGESITFEQFFEDQQKWFQIQAYSPRKGYFTTIFQDITEQKQMQDELWRAKEIADRANKSKSEFLAKMSHEIRTPLNGVIGFTELLMKTPLTLLQKQHSENAINSGKALLGIVNDILDFSKIEAGKLELDPIKTDIIQLMQQTADMMKFQTAEKKLTLLLNINPAMPRYAIVDPVRHRQILINLLGNAVKFTKAGEVELRLDFTAKDSDFGRFTFSVRDTGIGIEESQQVKLFKAFSQSDNSTTRKYGGTGLGLIISKRLAEKMGAKISVESEVGRGSVFMFSIDTNYYEDEVGEQDEIRIKRVLLIDGNEKSGEILKDNLEHWNVETVICINGFEAIKLLEESPDYDLILMDYHISFMNGLKTLRLIREKLKLDRDKLPVVMMSNPDCDQIIRSKTKNLGILRNLIKPVKTDELLKVLVNSDQVEYPEDDFSNEMMSRSKTIHTNTKTTIVIAEDVPLNMMLVTTLIKQSVADCQIIEAINGNEAVEAFLKYQSDLILMDVHMPEMDGLEATRKIREYEKKEGRNCQVPIIALTAAALNEDKKRCLDAGMDGFLPKPIETNLLMNYLEKYLSVKEMSSDFNQNGKETTNREVAGFNKPELMERIYHDQELYKLMLESIGDLGDQIDDLGVLIKSGKLDDVKKLAHKIKGIGLNLSFSKLADVAYQIEKSAGSGDDNQEVKYNLLKTEWTLLEKVIESELAAFNY